MLIRLHELSRKVSFSRWQRQVLVTALICWITLLGAYCGEIQQGLSSSAEAHNFRERARLAYSNAKNAWQTNRTGTASAATYGRTAFDWADFAASSSQRAEIAEGAIAACRGAIESNPTDAPAIYYLAMNLGQLARTKSLGALKIVREMEDLFERARALNERYDEAGPHRNLGLLYLETPGRPTSIGSRPKARQNLKRAIELSPKFPENRLCLIEAYAKWRDWQSVATELDPLDANWPEAQSRWTGPDWERSWVDWESRRNALRQKFAHSSTTENRKK